MSIFYNPEKDMWSLEKITEEELHQLTELGKVKMLEMLGASLLVRYQNDMEKQVLENIPQEQMGNA